MWYFKIILFAVFCPGVFFSFPPHSSLFVQSIVHGLGFLVAEHYLSKLTLERFSPDTRKTSDIPCQAGYTKTSAGDCMPSEHISQMS